jgi:hypothetical protein
MDTQMNVQTLKGRILSKEYVLQPLKSKRSKSVVWETMHLIIDQQKEVLKGYVACVKCNLVLKRAKVGSTKNLLDHHNKCGLHQTRIGKYFLTKIKQWR